MTPHTQKTCVTLTDDLEIAKKHVSAKLHEANARFFETTG